MSNRGWSAKWREWGCKTRSETPVLQRQRQRCKVNGILVFSSSSMAFLQNPMVRAYHQTIMTIQYVELGDSQLLLGTSLVRSLFGGQMINFPPFFVIFWASVVGMYARNVSTVLLLINRSIDQSYIMAGPQLRLATSYAWYTRHARHATQSSCPAPVKLPS